VVAALLPLVFPHPYVLQTLTNSWLYALLGLSLTLIAGTVGLVSLGHAGLLRSAAMPRHCWRSIAACRSASPSCRLA
jgi:branched-chain amino acid transport system permease protein